MKKIGYSCLICWISIMVMSQCGYRLRHTPTQIVYCLSFIFVFSLICKYGFRLISLVSHFFDKIPWLSSVVMSGLYILHIILMTLLAILGFTILTYSLWDTSERVIHDRNQTYLVKRSEIGFHHITVVDRYYAYNGFLVYPEKVIKEDIIKRD